MLEIPGDTNHAYIFLAERHRHTDLRREKRKPGVQERRAEKRKREREGRTTSGGSQGEVEMGRVDWKGELR